jgi:hypothetical protein
MCNKAETGVTNIDVALIYTQLCESYRAIDEFRAKLLGYLPLVSGAGIFILVGDKAKVADFRQFLPAVGLFGIVVTLGLFAYELFGIKKCGALIDAGKRLEDRFNGQFKARPDRIDRDEKVPFVAHNEPFAAAIVYPAVLAAWTYVALVFTSAVVPWVTPLVVFVIGFGFTIRYDYRLRKEARAREQSEMNSTGQASHA